MILVRATDPMTLHFNRAHRRNETAAGDVTAAGPRPIPKEIQDPDLGFAAPSVLPAPMRADPSRGIVGGGCGDRGGAAAPRARRRTRCRASAERDSGARVATAVIRPGRRRAGGCGGASRTSATSLSCRVQAGPAQSAPGGRGAALRSRPLPGGDVLCARAGGSTVLRHAQTPHDSGLRHGPAGPHPRNGHRSADDVGLAPHAGAAAHASLSSLLPRRPLPSCEA